MNNMFSPGMMFGNVTLRREENPIKVTAIFSSDVKLTVDVNNSLADITVLLNANHKRKTRGLLGMSVQLNYNKIAPP